MYEYHRIWKNAGIKHLYSSQLDFNFIIDSHHSCKCNLVQPLPFYWNKISLPIAIIWTYWELDQDFRGTSNPERIHLWKAIMRAKQWDERDIAMWPVVTFANNLNYPQFHVDTLFSVVNTYNPQYILCFGSKIKNVLVNILPDACTHISTCKVLFLPGAEDMLPDNKSEKSKAWEILKKIVLL